jgi:hypothetical protein
MHQAQGLTFDRFTFDSKGVTKHTLTYKSLSRVNSKEHLCLLSSLSRKNFQVDPIVKEILDHLQIYAH